MITAGNPTLCHGLQHLEQIEKLHVTDFCLQDNQGQWGLLRGLLSICKKHKKPVRTWVSLFVPQSWAQPCQTQPCNVKCWLSPEAGATHHNKEQKKLLLTTMRNSNSPFPPEKKPCCWEASCLVSQHVKQREREESKQGISGKIRAVFVTLPSAGQSWSHTITPLHVFYIPDSENTETSLILKTLKHMCNIWSMCLITMHCLHLKVDCVILTQNKPLHFWYDHVLKSNYKVGRV